MQVISTENEEHSQHNLFHNIKVEIFKLSTYFIETKDETSNESIGVDGCRHLSQMSTVTTLFTKLMTEEAEVLMAPEEQILDEEAFISSVQMAPSMKKGTLKVSQEFPDVAQESEFYTRRPMETDHDATGIVQFLKICKINYGYIPIYIINFCQVKKQFFF